ncbi:hypothetical protein [Streptomyces sp. enrichment culture]
MRTSQAIRGTVDEFSGTGMNEVACAPALARLEEVDRLADLLL